MISNRLRALGLSAVAALAISALGSAIPARRIALLLTSVSDASARRASPFPKASVLSPDPLAQTINAAKPKRDEQFTLYTNAAGEIVCRAATPAERRQMDEADVQKLGLHPINHLDLAYDKFKQSQTAAAGNLTIVLRATQQLEQDANAKAAFIKAAQNWETLIKSPITIYIDVDYGTTRFGQPWPDGVLGSTSTPTHSYPYQSVRTNLIAEADGEGNATKQSIFGALPSTTVPTDLGDSGSTVVSDSTARAIGLLPATAQSTDAASRIAFNSNFTFDFDPADGITSEQIDFDAVATHEIGHALGFSSAEGLSLPRPSVWDLYRFRTGTMAGTFPTATRILTIGGSPDPLQFYFAPGNAELGLSTGGPAGSTANGGDGWQSSHWKHVASCASPIGIMDPALPSGCRRTINNNDVLALSTFGYNLTNNNAPPPPPPPPPAPANDNFTSAQVISGCSGNVGGTTFGATNEPGEPSHDPSDSSSLSPNHTIWYQWQAPSSGTTTITTGGSDFDTILAVYTGTSIGSLTRLVFNDDVQLGVVTTSKVTFNASSGTTYRIAVDGWGGDAGTVKLNWNGCVALPQPGSIVISQVYGGGGTPGAIYQNSYIELFNRTSGVIDIGQWRLRFTDSNGSQILSLGLPNSPYLIEPGQHLLIRLGSAGSNGVAVPVAPDIQVASVVIDTSGQIALTLPGTTLSGTCPIPNSSIVDFVGFGGSLTCYEGSGPSASQANTTAALRSSNGCTDTDNNNNDFSVGAPNPRSRLSTSTPCSGPTPTPTPTPTPVPTASPTPPTGEAVAFQINPAHSGSQMDGVTPPLMQRWSRNLGGTVSYPLIAGGRVFVMTRNQSSFQTQLYGLDEVTGENLWFVDLPSTVFWPGIAYDANRVFAVRADGLVQAFEATSGSLAWSKELVGNSQVGAPPVATAGTVFVQGGGVGATVYGLAESDGTVKWTAHAPTGGPSYPAVSSAAVYVSFACNQAYAFSPLTGTLYWHHSSSCSGGGGSTPALFSGRVYVRDRSLGNLVMDAATGSEMGSFLATAIPAFSGSTGYFLNDSTLEARDVTSGGLRWSFAGDGTLTSAPITDNGYVYIGSRSGKLYALDANSGSNVWTGAVGAAVTASDEQIPLTGIGAGHGLVIVPASNLLVAFQSANPIDQSDFFVKQHYLDFLNRQPDQSGWDFWTNQITSCGTNAHCIEVARVNVSASFFLSIEFQQTGYLVERMYKVAYGSATGNSTFNGAHQFPVPVVRFDEFLSDTQRIGQGVVVLQPGWEQALENNKQAYAQEFVQTSRFTEANAFPTTMTPAEFVDKLNQNAGSVLSSTERTMAIDLFGGAGNTTNTTARAQAVRQVADDIDLYNAEFNRAFVLAQYFGYLRRNPDDAPEATRDYTGYDFWLTKLNQFNGNYIQAEMVKAFLSSIEYRQRFGP